MTSDAFVAWAMQQPDGARCELVGGEVVRMASERVAHARTKLRIARLLQDGIQAGKLDCEVFGDGMSVEIDPTTIYVEVVPPSTASIDAGAKLADYFRIPSVRHCLIVRTTDRAVIQHSRAENGSILTRIVRHGVVELDPPGIVLAGLFD